MPTFAQSLAAAQSACDFTAHTKTGRPLSQPPARLQSQASFWLSAYALLLCALAIVLPAVTLPAHYHDFADQVAWGALPHARDVLSNAAFAVAGIALLWQVRRMRSSTPAAFSDEAVPALRTSGWGLVATAFASGIYHLYPANAGLALDRIGMVLAFAGMLGVLIADCLPQQRTLPVMMASLLLGVACVLADWLRGNMTPWVLYQAGAAALMLIVPMWQRFQAKNGRKSPSTLGVCWWQALLVYALAKAVEVADHQIWHFTGQVVSGHNLKHVVAACAVLPVLWALRRMQRSAPGNKL